MEYKFSINSNEYLPLREVVFNNLRDAILKGELKPKECMQLLGITKPTYYRYKEEFEEMK